MANVVSLDLSHSDLDVNAAKVWSLVLFLSVLYMLLLNDMQVLSEVVAANTSLHVLNLSHNGLGKHGTRILCNGLLRNDKLQVPTMLGLIHSCHCNDVP